MKLPGWPQFPKWSGSLAALALNLSTAPVTGLDTTFAWDPNPVADGVLQYTFYMDNGAGFKLLDVVFPGERPTYTVRGLVPGVAYRFYVTATTPWGETEPSNILKFGEAPPEPRRSIRPAKLAPVRKKLKPK